MGVELLERGAVEYMGVDASARMVERAKARLDRERARVVHADLTTYRPAPSALIWSSHCACCTTYRSWSTS